jgi:hypothetical protein
VSWWLQLDKKRGSRPRCVLLTDGSREVVAQRLTEIVALDSVTVSPDDTWMPVGRPVPRDGRWDTSPAREARLDQASGLLPEDARGALRKWWLATPDSRRANTPNWDIASTCQVGNDNGLLLVEAKAHRSELSKSGKTLKKGAREASRWNHDQIKTKITEASSKLGGSGAGWNLTCDTHYQLSNRFAWSWKLASMGMSVVLVYLGFLHADEMADRGAPFASADKWRDAVFEYAEGIVPEQAWGGSLIQTSGKPFRALIKAMEVDFRVHEAQSD